MAYNPYQINQSVSGTVQAELLSTNASVITVGTAAPNQSVSGAVSISNFPINQNVSGSVISYPVSTNASVITVGTATPNQSVSGTVAISNFPITQNVSGSVFATGSITALQGTNPWKVELTSGSVITAGGNSSVMLTPGINTIGSVATLQATNPWIVQLTSGSVITAGGNSSVQVVGTLPPQSVSGVGTFNINPVGNGSVISTLINSSIATLQGTNPWIVQPTSGSVFAYQAGGSVMAVSGSFSGGNSSVQLVGGTAMIGSVAAYQGATLPWRVELTSGSIATTAGATGNSSVQVLGGNAMIGSVVAYQGVSPWIVQLSSGSVITAGGNSSVTLQPSNNVIGSVATLQSTNPWVIGNSSVMLTPSTNVVGSIAVLQGTNPWITGFSISPSIVGTYVEDAAHVSGDKGLFILQVRNDTMTSMTTASGEYSPLTGGPVGETIVANSPISKWITGFASITSGADTPIIAAGGASVFTYITSAQISMAPGPVNQVSFKNGVGGTIITRMYLPSSTAGINMQFVNPLKTLTNGAFVASISAIGSVMVNVQGFRSQFDV